MTKEELKIRLDLEESNINKKLLECKEAYENGSNMDEYIHSIYMTHIIVNSRNLDEFYILDLLIKHLRDFEEEANRFSKEPRFKLAFNEPTPSYENESGSFVYSYYQVVSEISTYNMNNTKRAIMAKLLKPENAEHIVNIECKVLQLFMDGVIDWLTLQKLTYTNCDL
jgi:hypothetical protein